MTTNFQLTIENIEIKEEPLYEDLVNVETFERKNEVLKLIESGEPNLKDIETFLFATIFPSWKYSGSPEEKLMARLNTHIGSTAATIRKEIVLDVNSFPMARLTIGPTSTNHKLTFATNSQSSAGAGSPAYHLAVSTDTPTVHVSSAPGTSSPSRPITGRPAMQTISPDPRDTNPTIRAASASPRAPVHKTAQLVSTRYKKLIRCE